ncbi:hypothetical protein RUM44_006625 [Polyplax serrata]|uniref:Uncharacterized protein n=1 Tax=Polyplax serrata TaxID=468196 RepID=A0ABR1AIN3_POLSC
MTVKHNNDGDDDDDYDDADDDKGYQCDKQNSQTWKHDDHTADTGRTTTIWFVIILHYNLQKKKKHGSLLIWYPLKRSGSFLSAYTSVRMRLREEFDREEKEPPPAVRAGRWQNRSTTGDDDRKLKDREKDEPYTKPP